MTWLEFMRRGSRLRVLYPQTVNVPLAGFFVQVGGVGMAAGDGSKRWGMVEVGVSIVALITAAGIPWAYTVGVDLARIAVSVDQMRMDIKQHIELPKHSGAPSLANFDKLDSKVDEIYEEQIEQRTILNEIKSAVKP